MLVFREAEKSVFVFFTREMENLLIVNFKGGYCKKKKSKKLQILLLLLGVVSMT